MLVNSGIVGDLNEFRISDSVVAFNKTQYESIHSNTLRDTLEDLMEKSVIMQ
jgi:hypothetical protein